MQWTKTVFGAVVILLHAAHNYFFRFIGLLILSQTHTHTHTHTMCVFRVSDNDWEIRSTRMQSYKAYQQRGAKNWIFLIFSFFL